MTIFKTLQSTSKVRPRTWLAGALLSTLATTAMALDILALWDFGNPEKSERQFAAAMDTATGDEKLILQTQIARTYGLRRDFAKARAVLAAVEPQLAAGSSELRVRYFLELGRTHASPAHPQDALTPDALAAARAAYVQAYNLAAAARLDYLAVDALHMMVSVDTAPNQQLEWNQKALAYMEKSDQPDARAWEGSLRNNVGYALHLKGDYEAALSEFRLSRAAYERAGKVGSTRIADWMIAWTYRAQKKFDQALSIQLELERLFDADGKADLYVYEELEHLYKALGNEDRAQHYGAKFRKASQ
jgi:tetratricopeptide (TPR) repeat protein